MWIPSGLINTNKKVDNGQDKASTAIPAVILKYRHQRCRVTTRLLGPGTRILTNLDNTFTGIATFSNGLDVSGGQLNLAGNMQFTAANPELEFNNGGPRFRVPAANTFTIHTGGGLGATSNERLRITSVGKVGINTASPRAVLDIEGNAEKFHFIPS